MEQTSSFEIVRHGRVVGQVDVQDASGALPHAADLCRAAAEAVADAVRAYRDAPQPWAVTLRLGGEDEGRALNRDFRHKDYATNVLSFPNDEPPTPDDGESVWYVGDIFICLPVLLREAREQDKPPTHHLQHLTVHGLLHLVGYDHDLGEREAEEMETLETDILTGMGLPAPYPEDVHA